MTNTVARTLDERVRDLEAQLANLQRYRTAPQPNLRDLRDVNATKAVAGSLPLYAPDTGTWDPKVIIPPFAPVDDVVVVATSRKWKPPWTVRVRRMYATLTTAGTSNTVIKLLKNGSIVATLTLGSAATTGGVDLDATYEGPETDDMQVDITSAGTGALGLLVHVS